MRGGMRQPRSNLRLTMRAAALASALTFGGAAPAEENCLYALANADDPYYVLGSLVTPQSNFLVVDRCGKTIDEVRADLVAPARERERERAEAVVRAQEMRVEGDRLERARQQQRTADAESQDGLRDWWDWIWTWSPF